MLTVPQLSVAVAVPNHSVMLAVAFLQSITKGAGAVRVGVAVSSTVTVTTARGLSQPLLFTYTT